MIEDSLCVTIEVKGQTGLSYGTTQRVINDHLQLTKITARYLPKQLTNLQRNKRIRIC